MKLTFGLFLLELKRTLKFMPRILLCAAALFIIAALLLRFGVKDNDSGDAAKVKIGYYNPNNDYYIAMVINMAEEMESVKSISRFEAAESKKAVYDGISSGKYYGGIIFPDNYVQGIMDGSNTPAVIIIPQSSKNSIFRRLVSVGSDMLISVQAGIYAAGEGKRLSRSQLLGINMEYVNFVMGRSKLFVRESWSPYGTLSIKQYYCASALTFLCMLLGICLSFMFYDYGAGFKSYCKLWQYNGVFMLLLKQLTVSIVVSFFAVLALFAVNKYVPFVEIKPAAAISAIFICAQLITCFYTVFGSSTVLLLTAFTLVTGFIGGLIVPPAYLGGTGLDKISAYMPANMIVRCFSSLYTYHAPNINIFYMSAVIYAVTFAACALKRGVQR